MKPILVIDNYDSFTYNLVYLIREISQVEPLVLRNDKVTLRTAEEHDKILLSPGPGIPKEAGLMPDIVETFASKKSILGICLGHQCIAEVFGGHLHNFAKPIHGKAEKNIVIRNDHYIFKDVPREFICGRYHSWTVARDSFPDCLEITAIDENDNIMGLAHRTLDMVGLQFHPESIMTEHGYMLMKNWIFHSAKF